MSVPCYGPPRWAVCAWVATVAGFSILDCRGIVPPRQSLEIVQARRTLPGTFGSLGKRWRCAAKREKSGLPLR